MTTTSTPIKNSHDTVNYTKVGQTDISENGNGHDKAYKENIELRLDPSDTKYLHTNGHSQQSTTTTSPKEPKPCLPCLHNSKGQSCCQRIALYSCLVGFVFIIVSIISALLMKPYVENKILENLPIRKGSEVYKGWKDPPVTPVVSFRVFNLTNLDAFLKGREKPNLVEVGPYAYRQKMWKVNISFAQTEPSVTFKVAKEYFFAPELSCKECKETDVVIVPNIPLFGAMEKLGKEKPYVKSTFTLLIKSYDFAIDSSPFLKVPVGEYLWGYPSILATLNRVAINNCSTIRKTSQASSDDWGFDDDDWQDDTSAKKKTKSNREPNPCDITEDNLSPFGLFVGRNGTGFDIRSVDTGVDRIEDKGLMVAWHNKRKLNYWKTPECNKLTGRDPAGIPLNLQKNDVLEIFIGQLCRTVKFKYVGEEKIANEFVTYRFTPLENSFDSPEDNPDNDCYCLSKPCNPSGILDIRGCQQYSPIFMSWPHFLYGDSDLKRGVNGIHPNQTKHAFYLDISPKYGITLRALARLQMNVIIRKNSGYGYFDNIAEDQVVLPFMWLEDGVWGPTEEISAKVRFLLNLPSNVQNLTAIVVDLTKLPLHNQDGSYTF